MGPQKRLLFGDSETDRPNETSHSGNLGSAHEWSDRAAIRVNSLETKGSWQKEGSGL